MKFKFNSGNFKKEKKITQSKQIRVNMTRKKYKVWLAISSSQKDKIPKYKESCSKFDTRTLTLYDMITN